MSGGRKPVFERRGATAVIDPDSVNRIIVIGDIHGDLEAFRHGVSLRKTGDLLVLLGDFADRGPQGVEVIEAVDGLLRRLPDRVIALKGNHEDYTPGGSPTFSPCTLIDEAEKKRGSWETFYRFFSEVIDRLALSILLPERALFVHGGISKSLQTVKDLENPSHSMMTSLLWSDPGSRKGSRPSNRGIGERFGPDISKTVLDALGVRHLIRGHEPRKALAGPYCEHDGRVITTSGTHIYGGRAFALALDPAHWPRSEKEIIDAAQYLSGD